MAYSERIKRNTPACVMVLIDQSGSMGDPWGTGAGVKADGVAEVANALFRKITLMARQGSAIMHYFDIGAIGYGGGNRVGSAFGGALKDRIIVSIPDLAREPLKVRERTEGEKKVK